MYTCSKQRPVFGCMPCMFQVATTFQMPYLKAKSQGYSRLSLGMHPSFHSTPRTPSQQTDTLVATTVFTLTTVPHLPDLLRSANGLLQLHPSPLCPNCKADEWIFSWMGVNTPPASTIDNPVIHYLADLANHASLHDMGSYGSGLQKFHIFRNVFMVPKSQQLPASFQVLHSFALWAATDPESVNPLLLTHAQFEPISVNVVKKYFSAVWAWHIHSTRMA